jgi:hypothetical protein
VLNEFLFLARAAPSARRLPLLTMVVKIGTADLASVANDFSTTVLDRVPIDRIKEARVQGYKRPDYVIKVDGQPCVVEIKQIDPTPADNALLQELARGEVKGRWIDPGARLTCPMRGASDQLRKFSMRGFPTVVCLFDNTAGFYTENIHVIQAMAGKETLRFEVSGDQEHQPRFLGVSFGKKATLTKAHNTSVGAVAVLRQPLSNISASISRRYETPARSISPIWFHLSSRR